MAWTPDTRAGLAAGFALVAAAIGLVTLWVALDTRSWDGLEAVLIPPLVAGVALGAGWACVLGVGLLSQWSWARSRALLTFVTVGVFSGLVLIDVVRRLVSSGGAPIRHLIAPASLFAVATSIVLLLARAPGTD